VQTYSFSIVNSRSPKLESEHNLNYILYKTSVEVQLNHATGKSYISKKADMKDQTAEGMEMRPISITVMI